MSVILITFHGLWIFLLLNLYSIYWQGRDCYRPNGVQRWQKTAPLTQNYSYTQVTSDPPPPPDASMMWGSAAHLL